jgi:cystathionine beta-lyase
MDFDKKIDRAGTEALKLEFRKNVFGSEEVLPLWVADMDFAVPEAVSQAICERAKHPIYGYTSRGDTFFSAIAGWLKRQHNWETEPGWIEYTPGVVPTLVLAVQAFTKPGDKVVIQPPVYPPFFNVIKDHEREVVENPLVNTPEGYQMDFDHLEQVVADPAVKLMLFCHPHNPVGRVWERAELERLGEICLRHKVLVVSDEIHADLTLNGYVHLPMASLSRELAANTITCMAPSKTFNIAGLNTSYIVVPNRELMVSMKEQIQAFHLFTGNMFGAVALEAAYKYGGSWLEQLKVYIQGNIDLVLSFLAKEMPEVKAHRPQATYLMWLDFSAWKMAPSALKKFIIEEARLGLNDGPAFGTRGEGFQRLNVASSREVIMKALTQLLAARNTLNGKW